MTASTPDATDANERAWALLLAARGIVDSVPVEGPVSLYYKVSSGTVETGSELDSDAELYYQVGRQWRYRDGLPEELCTLFDLYLPVLGTHENPVVVVGHLGQSIDSRIATTTGDAMFVTGEENRKHLHRMRALCHAVLVGAETVVADDPQLTTRAVSGPNPVRVVIDPKARVPDNIGLLGDGETETWLLHRQSVMATAATVDGAVQRIGIAEDASGRLPYASVLSALAERGIRRVFVEGGGVTVSGMLSANCLHQLQIAAAPVLVGEGRAALQLPGVVKMRNALRPPFKLYRMGSDVLWDFDVRGLDASEDGETLRNAVENDDSPQPAVERLL